MIVDTHMHSWLYPDQWNKEVMLLSQPERRRSWPDEKFKAMWDNPIETYLRETEGVIDKAIIMGLKSADIFGLTIPNDYLSGLKRRYPDRVEWCCTMDLTQPEAIPELERCVNELGAIGVGEIGPSYQNFYLNDERAYPFYHKAQEMDIPLVLHAGPPHLKNLRMKYADLAHVDDVAIDFPKLKIVIAHMGFYKFADAIHLAMKHENVYLDCSQLTSFAGLDRKTIPKYLPAVLNPYFNLLSPLMEYWAQGWGYTDKLLWGSDWPATHPKTSVDILLNLNKTLEEAGFPKVLQQVLDNIIYENWKQVYPKLVTEAKKS